MLDWQTIYTQEVAVGKIIYIIESCCNGEELCLWIYTYATIFVNYKLEEVIRYINDGIVDWHQEDYKTPVIQDLIPIANNIALETDKLLHRAIKLNAFS